MTKRRITLFLLCMLFLSVATVSFERPQPAQAATRLNYYPVVLVHGFMGWGRNELLGFKYWGGFTDLEQDLRNNGYETYTVGVGPVSSNWDRAVELYYQIKGGTVDYGQAHATKHGHARYGRTYPGLYTKWGQKDANGQTYKIHLLTHSMGGQTARTLIQLLEQGSPEERAATPAASLSPLFAGGKSWVSGALTVSAPHDGTTLASGIGMIPLAQELVALIGATAGVTSQELYDFKLDQWGLKRQAGESFSSYTNRVYNSTVWNTKDISAWDLTPDGAKQLNQWVKASPNVYYFSVGTEQTYQSLLTGHQVPELGMNPILSVFTTFMGAYTRYQSGTVTIDSSWWQNDGVVNTRSMRGPTLGSTDAIVNYNGTPQKGKWNYLGLVDSEDHIDIIGIGLFDDVRSTYRSWANLLASLPKS